jgi:mycothiol system anti-sigma-R factor
MSDIDCQTALEQLYEYLDGELAPTVARAVHHHLELCASCYPEVKLTSEFREALQRAADGQPCCPEGLRERIALLIQHERHT